MDARFGSGDVDALLALVQIDPATAAREARVRLAGGGDDRVVAKLHWVLGLASRESGDLDAATSHLVEAATIARAAGEDALWARISSSHAIVLAQRGDLDAAVDLLHAVEPLVDGADRAGVIGQLGLIAYWRGDLKVAESGIRACCEAYEQLGDTVLEGRFRANLGAVLSLANDLDGAEMELRRAAELAEAAEMKSEAGIARANLGYVATLRGDLPEALAQFSASAGLYRDAEAEAFVPRLLADHAQALADAGMFADAETLVRQAIEMYRAQGQETELAGVLLTSAAIRLAASDIAGAVDAANEAEAKFRSQDRASWAAVAHDLSLQASTRLTPPPDGLAEAIEESATLLAHAGRGAEAIRSWLLALKLRAEQSRPGVVAEELRSVVDQGRSADQILLAHVDALTATANGDDAGARGAVERGLDVATVAQSELGSIEARAYAAAHGHELVELGARLALTSGNAGELLTRIEATRVMASRLSSVRPPVDAEMAAMLAELRRIEGRLADPDTEQGERSNLERRRVDLERDVRQRSRTLRGDGVVADLRTEVQGALGILGDRQLVAHAALDGRLHAVSVVGGRSKLHDLGSLDGVRDKVEGIAFAINRLNRGQGSDASRLSAAEMLFGLADELAELLLPPAIAESFDPVVVVPTAVLHDVPWGLLPPLAGRSVSVNASFTGWARAERARADRARRSAVGFVAGPGLEFADVEVKELASYYPSAITLNGADATGDRCLELFGDAHLVHVACHGTFRTDNPLFSSIHVADGPLNVYDFEQVEQLPDTVILSACSVAGSKVLHGGSLLGLATALTTLGACTVIAPLTPVSDAASVTVMQRLHQAIVAGDAPAAALATAIMSHDMADPTAAAFIALGA